jgi:site-specific recombinase XerD
MRKHSLRQIASQYLDHDNRGSPRGKKYRRFVILRMIEDLFVLGIAPSNWTNLTSIHLQQLIQHWHKKKVKPSTLMNYMTIIRKFLNHVGHNAQDIDNLSLGLQNKKSQKKTRKFSIDLLEKINDPVTRVLVGFQIHFGLTLSEAMRILLGVHIQEHELLLTREITFNSKDRKIPIRSEVQIKLIQDFNILTQGNGCLITTHGYRAICFSWQKAMKSLRLSGKKCWRYLYAQQLSSKLSSQISHYRLSLIIMDEMGLKSRTTLWGYLNEQ